MQISKVKLTEEFDRRRKLTEVQKEEIRNLYIHEKITYQQLADMYDVSKKTICLVVNTEARDKQYSYSTDYMRSYRQSQDRETINKQVRERYQYKKDLIKKGLITVE